MSGNPRDFVECMEIDFVAHIVLRKTQQRCVPGVTSREESSCFVMGEAGRGTRTNAGSSTYKSTKNLSSMARRAVSRATQAACSDRHRAADLVVVELAGRIAIGNPGALHGLGASGLIGIQCVEQRLVIFVEQSVPDRAFHPEAVGRGLLAGVVGPFSHAGLGDKPEEAPPLAVLQIVLVPGRAGPDRGDFIRRGFTGLRASRFGRKPNASGRIEISAMRSASGSFIAGFLRALLPLPPHAADPARINEHFFAALCNKSYKRLDVAT